MLKDNNLSIILGRPFLNTTRVVIDCTNSKLTFNVEGKEHTIYFPKKSILETPVVEVKSVVNSNEVRILMVGTIAIPIPPPPPKYEILMIGSIPIKY
jgi:hypothetical protein